MPEDRFSHGSVHFHYFSFFRFFFQIDELKMYMNIKRLRDLKLDDKGSIGYTFKCMGAGFWALKKDDFRNALQKIVLAVKFKLFFNLNLVLLNPDMHCLCKQGSFPEAYLS